MTDNILTVEHLTVKYGRHLALNDVSFELLDRGSVVGLFGQNGAGKTTLLRVIAGLINRFQGVVSPRGSAVGYLPDEPFLYREMRISDVVRTCDSLFEDFDSDIATSILRELRLPQSIKVASASKGMSEQVHLAMLLSRRCRLYVFDEPLAAVDPLTRDQLLTMIHEYRTPGSTVLISTHLIGGLENVFDEALVVHQGSLVLQDEVPNIVARGGLEQRFKEVVSAVGA